MITVEFLSSSRKLDANPINFEPDWEPGGENDPFRVRHLIEKLVRESVRDFHRRENGRGFEFLTNEKIEMGIERGKFWLARQEKQSVDVESAVGNALQAFEDGLFLLFVDEQERRSLEDLVHLRPETKITLVRLTALTGGW